MTVPQREILIGTTFVAVFTAPLAVGVVTAVRDAGRPLLTPAILAILIFLALVPVAYARLALRAEWLLRRADPPATLARRWLAICLPAVPLVAAWIGVSLLTASYEQRGPPLWITAAAVALGAAIGLVVAGQRRRVPGPATCARCGYERPAQRTPENDRCSECGNDWWNDRLRPRFRNLARGVEHGTPFRDRTTMTAGALAALLIVGVFVLSRF